MDPNTFNFLNPTPAQSDTMKRCRDAFSVLAEVLEKEIPGGPDKTYVLRLLRTTGTWTNIAITRHPDGSPRQ